MKKNFLYSAIVVGSTMLALIIVEGLMRTYVYVENPEIFEDTSQLPNFFGLYDRSLWVFDERHGYSYPPKRKVHLTSISDGKVAGCSLLDYVNSDGNIGDPLNNHADPDHTIAVFGDSWTAFYVDGKTWPAFLKEKLEDETGKKINVHNC